MSKVGEIERQTQNNVIKTFKEELGYEYLGNWQDRTENSNLEEALLRTYLSNQGYDENIINKSIYEIQKIINDPNKDLYYANKDFYEILRYGLRIKPDVSENSITVWLINWENPLLNHLALAEEVTISCEGLKRPDIVFYINGIALGILELKRSTVSVTEGIRQNITNQRKDMIRPFFNTVQIIMAGNNTEGLRYGVIETPEKHYLTWKEFNAPYEGNKSLLTQRLLQVCTKQRLLEFIHDFIVFDARTKKMCRHNQYYGVKLAQEYIKRQEGGIIWHTQGSGKSITMVWLAKWILENMPDSRVLIITDRTELDEQIEKVFNGVNEEIYQCISGLDLISKLGDANPRLICSLIHKFDKNEENDYDAYLSNLKQELLKNFIAKGNIYVFVDECHRTQSGALHEAMKQILPKSLFIGFTGTPLLKKDKKKSVEVFGKYIHTYKYDEAVRDGVVLDLRYEARDIDQEITSPDKIDQWFAAKTKGLNDFALVQLKKKWGTMQRVLSSQSRLEKIVADILLDMETRDRLSNDHGNALLVSGSIYQACRFYELFLKANFTKCAIITSYEPSTSEIRTEDTGEGLTEKLRQYEIYNRMLNGQTVEKFEEEVKKKFIKEPGQMKLLIVVDKLLTGFDAPPATYLYIDKKMQDHALFQAICRVNRLDSEDKEYGYIVDYKDLFHSLENTINDYTSSAFQHFDKEDVSGLLTNRLDKAKEKFENSLECIQALCEPVAHPKNSLDYLHYFCTKDTTNGDELKNNEPKRIALYKQVSSLLRSFSDIANEYDKIGYTTKQFEAFRMEVAHYENVRGEVKINSGDYIDLKSYEPAMRHLLDTYIRAEDSVKISAFDDLSLIDLIVKQGPDALKSLPKRIRENNDAVAETIENNLRKIIVDEQPVNPKYYEKMSQLLDELIKKRKKQAIQYKEYLDQIRELSKKVTEPNFSTEYPSDINTSAKRALYDNLDKNAEVATVLDNEICNTKKDDWRGNKVKEREVLAVIRKHVVQADVERIFEIVKNQKDY